MRNKYLIKLNVLVLWAIAVHCILSTMQWAPPGYSIKTAQYISLAYLFTGLIFLFLNKFRLLIVCFGCSAAISFLIHEMTIPPNPKVEDKKIWNQTDSIQRQPPPFIKTSDL